MVASLDPGWTMLIKMLSGRNKLICSGDRCYAKFLLLPIGKYSWNVRQIKLNCDFDVIVLGLR
jgi:hypothetical protein